MDLTSPAGVARAARTAVDVRALDDRVPGCRACPRLVAWRERVAEEPRAAYRGQTYWARPVPGFGDPQARIVLVGLAPAAHGANRTGRMFTGDRTEDVLTAALHRAGLANQATSTGRDDGLALHDVRLTAPVHCAPPGNAPTPDERRTCAPWFTAELSLVGPRVVVALGAIGWQATWAALDGLGWPVPRPRPRFGHGAQVDLRLGHDEVSVLGCYHVSQRNTFTGRLTPAMVDDVLARARALADAPRPAPELRTVAAVRAWADALPGAALEYPFGPGTGVHKVGGRMFLLTPDSGGSLSVKCDPDWARALRTGYPAVTPGWHLNKRHWIGVDLRSGFAADPPLDDGLVADLVDASYHLVVAGLPARVRAGLG